MLRAFCQACLLCLFTLPVVAAPALYLHNGPESQLDKRYEFHWDILRTALEKTTAQYGPFEMRSAIYMTESRQTSELLRATGKLTVMFRGTSEELESQLLPIRIPVDRDLSGYFVLLIRPETRDVIAKAMTINDLRKLKIGLGADWLDNKIYRANEFQTAGGLDYNGLFAMLMQKRFDAFPRSVVELLDEYDQRKSLMPDLTIEETLLIHYYWPMYFWFSNNAEGKALAQRAEQGMRMMIKDGSYKALFMKYFHSNIERLGLKNRRLLELHNPLLPGETPILDAELWFSPLTARTTP